MNHRRELQSGCFVIDQSDLDLNHQGTLAWAQAIGDGDQASALSLFYVESAPGISPAILAGQSEVVLYLQSGRGAVSISGRTFDAIEGDGLYVRSGEQFQLENPGPEQALWLLSFCPLVKGLTFAGARTTGFDAQFPDRCIAGSLSALHETEGRYYKLLAGPAVGSEQVTQFIGRIPPSKAPEHFHLYEEAICILSGAGRLWNGDTSTPVGPGSMIFLPRKQRHSLECLSKDGMELMGVFYPAGSPAINYKT